MNTMVKKIIFFIFSLLLLMSNGCASLEKPLFIQDVLEVRPAESNQIWLSHEHILVDFIGADSIQPSTWNHDDIMKNSLP
jgi:phosphotriesterase-related protein